MAKDIAEIERKAAIVHAARLFEGVTQVSVKQSVLVLGDGQDDRGDQLIALSYDEVRMREDTPRNASGTPDLRYRAQYWPWRALLRVQVISSQFDEGSFFALVDAAGIGALLSLSSRQVRERIALRKRGIDPAALTAAPVSVPPKKPKPR